MWKKSTPRYRPVPAEKFCFPPISPVYFELNVRHLNSFLGCGTYTTRSFFALFSPSFIAVLVGERKIVQFCVFSFYIFFELLSVQFFTCVCVQCLSPLNVLRFWTVLSRLLEGLHCWGVFCSDIIFCFHPFIKFRISDISHVHMNSAFSLFETF